MPKWHLNKFMKCKKITQSLENNQLNVEISLGGSVPNGSTPSSISKCVGSVAA